MLKGASFLFVLVLALVIYFEIPPHTSSYSFLLNVLHCDNVEYMRGCRHEVGHKMDDDLGMPSLTEDFGKSVQLYIFVEFKKETPSELALILFQHPGLFVYEPSHPFRMQRELYASIYAYFEGDVSLIPDSLRVFYSDDPSYLDLYSCLARPGRINVCDGMNVAYH